MFFVICYLLSVICYLHHLSFIVYCLLFIVYSLFFILSFIFYLYLFFILYSLFFILYSLFFIYIYKRKEKQRKIKKIKEVKKKFQKKCETENFQNSLFFSVFSVFLFFGNAIYSLLFHRSMRAFFALKISAFFGVVFLHFLPVFCRRCSVTFVAVQRGGCLLSLPTPPLYRRSRNKSNPKKNFFIFFF